MRNDSSLVIWACFALVYLSFGVLGNTLLAEPVAIEEKAWPDESRCSSCVTITIGAARIAFNPENMKSIEVLSASSPAASLRLSRGASDSEVMLLSLSETEATGGLDKTGHYEALGVNSVTEFLDRIGEVEVDNDKLRQAREIMGISDANGYYRYRKPGVSAYWIEKKHEAEQYLYIVPDATKGRVELVAGELDHDNVRSILSRLTVTSEY